MSNIPATNSGQGGVARIYDALQSVVAAVPFALIQMALFDAITEFCTRSMIWRQVAAWTLAPNVAFTDLNPLDTDTLIAAVLRVNGLAHYRILPPALLVDDGDITVRRTGTVLVVCKPARLDEFDIPGFIADEWSEYLRDGAMARLLLQPGRPWSDPKLAQYHGNRFRSGIWLAKDMVRRSGDLPVPGFPYFARGQQRGYGMSETSFTPPNVLPPELPNSPLPINDGEADVDGGKDFNDTDFGDVDGGTF